MPLMGISLVVQWLRLCFQCKGNRFDSWSGNQDPTGHEVRPKQTNKKQKGKKTTMYSPYLKYFVAKKCQLSIEPQ